MHMTQAAAAAFLMLVLLFGGPWLTADGGQSPSAPESSTGAAVQEPAPDNSPTADGSSVLKVWNGTETVEMTMAEYLPGVVRGEMPATFEEEALKAQAVAERTYIYYHLQRGGKANHPDADVCMDHTCCNAWTGAERAAEKWGEQAEEYEAKIQEAVRATDGQVMLYHGQLILAAFHSSSAGVTASCRDVWVQDLPYLTSVESPEGEGSVPNYYSVKEFTASEFQKIMRAAHAQADFSGSPDTWVTNLTRNGSDRVETLTVGGVTVEGTEMRSLYGLRSACFTVDVTADTVTFHVTGYGHGVGMSQYGANELARQGKTWQEILHWYYTDVSIETYHR